MSELLQFCIRARYPDEKNELKRIATAHYTQKRIEEIKALRKWLLQLLSQPSNR